MWGVEQVSVVGGRAHASVLRQHVGVDDTEG